MRRLLSAGFLLIAFLLLVHAAAAQEYPKEILGKNLEAWSKDIVSNPDPSIRELALRTVVAFGPECRKVSGPFLLQSLNQEKDLSVKLTAVGMVPVIGFEKQEQVDAAIKMLVTISTGPQVQARYEAIMALATAGPGAKAALKSLRDFSITDPNSWQIRRAACIAVASVGVGEKDKDGKQLPPESATLGALVRATRDSSLQVRRQAVQSLVSLEPSVTSLQDIRDMTKAMLDLTKDKDKSVVIWARVCLVGLEGSSIKEDSANIKELIKFFKDKEAQPRAEAISAVGHLGTGAAFKVPDLMEVVEKDEDLACKTSALWALSQMDTAKAKVIPFLEKIRDTHQNEGIRKSAEAAITALNTAKPKDETPAVPKKDEPKKKP